MIQILLAILAVVEFIKFLASDSYARLTIRFRRLVEARKQWKANPVGEEPTFEFDDGLTALLMTPFELMGLFCCFWVLVFGENINAQLLALGMLALSVLQNLLMSHVSLNAIRFRTFYARFDAALSVWIYLAMAYFYQRPL